MELSVVIIAKNEEQMIQGCLETLTWVKKHGEILLIDTGSIDNTVAIAKKYGARIVEYKTGKNFSDWRNKGAREAKGQWAFYLDADERVTKDLEGELLERIASDEYSAYAIPRRNFVLGQELKHGGFYPDYQKRLFHNSAFEMWTGELHEEPLFGGSLGHFKSPMIHEKHETLYEMVEKTNRWSSVEGKLMFDAGHPPMNILRFMTAMLREFWQRMIIGKAFLDGRVGIIFAIYQVFSRFTSYAKLWELQIKNAGGNL